MASPSRVSIAAPPLDSLAEGERIYQAFDPLDPRRVSMDIFELYCHEMLMTTFVGRRAFLIQKMRYLNRQLIGAPYDYGRLYTRTVMANLTARVCGRHAYSKPEEFEDADQPYQLGTDCLVDFPTEKWIKTIDQFEHLRQTMLRNDATLIVLPSGIIEQSVDGDLEELAPEADEEINEELASHGDFSKRYTEMMDLMKFHLCLSHLQPQLETAIQKGSITGAESVLIPHNNIVAFDSAIEEQFGDDKDTKHARILSDLLDTRQSRQERLHLKSFREIKQTYDAHPRKFDLEKFQHSFLQLIRRWTDLVLPVPELAKSNYGSTDNINKKPVASVNGKETVHAPGAEGKAPSSSASSYVRQQKYGGRERKDKKSPLAIDNMPFENEVGDDLVDSSEDEKEQGQRRKRKAMMIRSQCTMAVAVMTIISLCNLAMFVKTVRKYMQPSMPSNVLSIPPPEHSREEESDNTCFEDIKMILSKDRCFDFHNNIQYLDPPPSSSAWDRAYGSRQKLHPSFWKSDTIARCINEDYELIGLTYGAHILVGAQSILGSCPTIVVDAGWEDPTVPGSISKQATLVPSELPLSENPRKTSIFPFRNQMTLKEFRDAAENARIMIHHDPSLNFFITNSCSIFPLDILTGLGIDFKGEHREAVTTLVLKGLLSRKETTDTVMSIIREKLRGKIGGTVWASLKSEKAVIHRVISTYIDNHNMMGIDLKAGGRGTGHKHLLIKIHKFLSRRTDSKFYATVAKRLHMS